MKRIIHPVAGAIAMLLITSFWLSTVISELFLSTQHVLSVKQYIAYALILLVPLMMMTAGTGFSMTKNFYNGLLEKKKKRMRIIGMNGLLIMVPVAIYLYHKALANEFDTLFYIFQIVELLIGVIQLSLMSMNFKEGLKLAGKIHSK